MADVDSRIAATALEHGLVLVTRNMSDFCSAPVVRVNPRDGMPGAQYAPSPARAFAAQNIDQISL